MAIVVADINSLKVVNDAFGHNFGDILIKSTAEVLTECCGDYGSVSRIGGDEFGIIIPNANLKIIEKMICKIDESMKSIDSLPVKSTISVGYAVKMSEDEKLEDTICKAENIMYEQKLSESKKMKKIIIDSLKDKLKDHTSQDEISVRRLIDLSNKMAKALNFDRETSLKLEMLVDIHNIGEFSISKEIFDKKNKLSLKEKDMIKSHVKRAYHITNASYELNKVSEEILSHHERWDGKGYPRSLKGECIPVVSRAFSIIDAYNSMVSFRAYRESKSHEEAIVELTNCAGTQFDEKMVDVFVNDVFVNDVLIVDNSKNDLS